MGMDLPDFRERQVENRTKLEKCSISQGFEGEFSCLSLNGKNTPIYHSFSKYLLTPELSQRTPRNYVFEQIFKHSLNFEPPPPLISGLNCEFDYATLCVLN